MKLTGRLEEIVRWVPECERVIDVGTDHALVPIALLSRNIIHHAIGIDKSPLPLGQATVNRHNAEVVDRLRLVCASGLEIEDLESEDVVVMAGMGGRTMQDILQSSSWRGTLVLQPNRDVPELRQWLSDNGWYSDVETIVRDRSQYFWTSRWYRGYQKVSPLQMEFGNQTHVRSKCAFTEWFLVEYKRLTNLPRQAVDRKKMPLYVEMAKALSNLENMG